MNKLYDKQYPVTSILLLVTTGFFLTMFLLRGFAYASTQTIYEFGLRYILSGGKLRIFLARGIFCFFT